MEPDDFSCGGTGGSDDDRLFLPRRLDIECVPIGPVLLPGTELLLTKLAEPCIVCELVVSMVPPLDVARVYWSCG